MSKWIWIDKKKRILSVILLSIALLFVYMQVDFGNHGVWMPVKTVEISGSVKFTHGTDFREVVERHIQNGFFGLRTDVLRNELLALPWIQRAVVARIWPFSVRIHIEEYAPVAVWNETAFMTKEYKLFYPPVTQHEKIVARIANMEASLPQLFGGEGRHAVLSELYRKLVSILKIEGEQLRSLKEDSRLSVHVTLQSGREILLGRGSRHERLQRLTAALPQLVQLPSWANIVSVDMRYDNGLVVRHKTEAGA